MITLDGVMQAPGGPEEDTSGGFKYGGWTAPYTDANSSQFFQKNMQPTDLLLGRTTFEIWEPYWPYHPETWPGINNVTKYVLSETRSAAIWLNTVFLNDIEAIKELKNSEGTDLHVWGSSQLVQLLMKNDLVDEFRLVTYPLTLGQGKKLFGGGTIPATFTLTESTITPSGVIMANYKRAGEVKTGTVGA